MRRRILVLQVAMRPCFHLTLQTIHTATSKDQFDSELCYKQALKFILQKWNHHHKEDFTLDPTTGHHDILPTDMPDYHPTTNEWATQLWLYTPAYNHPDCRGLSILAGLFHFTHPTIISLCFCCMNPYMWYFPFLEDSFTILAMSTAYPWQNVIVNQFQLGMTLPMFIYFMHKSLSVVFSIPGR